MSYKGPLEITGPGSSTDLSICRFDGTSSEVIQNSGISLDNSDVISGVTQLNVDNLRLDGNTISSTDTNGDIVLAPDGTGVVSVTDAAIVPSGDRADSLGSATNSWDNLYTNGVSFDDGTNTLSTFVASTSFTPVVEFGGGSTGVTYGDQFGTYTRIGNMVFVKIQIVLTSKGTDTGAVTITGFPLTTFGSQEQYFGMDPNRIRNSASCTQYFALIPASSSTIQIWNTGSGNVEAQITDADCFDNAAFRLYSVLFV